MRVEFDRQSNVANIRLVADVEKAMRNGSTYTVGHPHARGMIILDFDSKGRLVEIEVMDATQALPAEFLAEAKKA